MGLARRPRYRRGLVVLAGVLLSVAGPAALEARAIGLPPIVPGCAGTDWPMFGHDAGRSFATPDTCISAVGVAAMTPAWYYDAGSPVTAQPVVVGTSLYAGTYGGRFFALDTTTTSATGAERWSFDIGDCSHACDNERTDFGRIPGTAAVTTIRGRPLVVFGGGDTIFVLDARDGRLVASQCLDPVDPTCQGGAGYTYEIESSPVLVPHANGSVSVIVGTDVNEHDPSGPVGVIALDLTPSFRLTPRWQYDPSTGVTTPGLTPYDPAHPDTGGCGDVWSSPTMAGGQLVFGSGNCQPDGEIERDLTTALDPDTGAFLWSNGVTSDGLDLDIGATANDLGGGLVGEAGKDGWYRVYDGTGRAVSAVQAAVGSDFGGIIGSTAVGWATVGGRRHRVVFAASALPVSTRDPQASLAEIAADPGRALGVHAVDLDAAGGPAVLWHAASGPAFGAVTFANGVVFVPDTVTGTLLALDSSTGAVLRAQPTGPPPASPAAIVGRRVYAGAGITEAGAPGLSSLGGVWAFDVPA